jgi:hypothetical protein
MKLHRQLRQRFNDRIRICNSDAIDVPKRGSRQKMRHFPGRRPLVLS